MKEFKSDIEILKSIVGDRIYKEIRREFAGSSLYIPKMDKEIDYSELYDDIESGMSIKDLARKHNYTVVWIQKLYKEYIKSKFPQNEYLNKKTG